MELKARLAPRRLIHDALADARRAGETVAVNSAEAAKSHPVALVSLVAGLAAIALRRKRGKRRTAHETDTPAPRLKSERTKARRARKTS
ncbi:hypothetical protein EAH87_02605 [Sphingomonas koreensis]|nr:hypothetical protein EAH87_02605 [Sphingomonas koreensis]